MLRDNFSDANSRPVRRNVQVRRLINSNRPNTPSTANNLLDAKLTTSHRSKAPPSCLPSGKKIGIALIVATPQVLFWLLVKNRGKVKKFEIATAVA